MLLDFFPSRRLTWYLAKTFASRIIAMLAMLVLVLMALDLLSQTGEILAYPGNGEPELLRYVSLRVPQLIARFLPYSVLLATIITLATFNQNSEVVAMKAAGLSAHQILAPLLLTSLLVAVLSFVFNERVVTRATSVLSAWEAVEFGPILEETGSRTNVYLNDGQDILMARQVSGSGERLTMRGVSFYERGPTGMIVRQITADRAIFANPGWQLENAASFDVRSAEASEFGEPIVVARGIGVAQVELSGTNADAQPLPQLSRTIEALKASGRRTAELEAQWWHKISGPLSAVLMPLLGAVAGFGLARSGHLFARAVIGMALGFAYFVVDNAALAMGSFGGYPPLLAAWAPFFLFLLVGETVLVRTEE